VTFGLDLFNTALRQCRFDFRDVDIISRLETMVVVVGNALYSNNATVLVLSMKTAAAIIKCPLNSLAKSIPVFVRQIIDIIRQAGSTESEVAQTALRSLATIIRDSPGAQVKEKDLVYLLELISPDLEEPSRQAVVFTMLRVIVSRKFIVPEIYDMMDKVSEIMVTSQSPPVQELCRGVLLQFLLEYPQGKGRLHNQMTFLAKNLSYVFESGRKSVMELLSAVIAKFTDELLREYSDLLFVALVMVIVNDDSSKCREMAAELIKNLFMRLDEDHRRIIMSHLHSWASQHSQPQLVRVSSQVCGFVIDAMQSDTLPFIPNVLEDLNAVVERSARQLTSIEEEDGMDVDPEWQVPYHSLIVLSKVLRVFPHFITEPDKVNWPHIINHLLFPHAWVRTAASRLLGQLFAIVPVASPDSTLPDTSPLSRVGMCNVAKMLCLQLKSEHLDATLSLQIVKNLFYIGKCFYAIDTNDVKKSANIRSEDEGTDDASCGVELNPLPWLFSKLSYQVKSADIARRNRSFAAVSPCHSLLPSFWS
jgi:U3 small nucleolar RNA-associated protein 20